MEALPEPAFDPSDRKLYKKLLRDYKRSKPEYEALAKHLEAEMERIAEGLGIYPIVTGRAKSLESLAEKVQRSGKNYGLHPLEELTDLCGVRVITHFLSEIRAFASQLRAEFIIDDKNSGDKKDTLAPDQFGYLSHHLIVRLKERPKIPGLSGEAIERLMNTRSEIQVRTLGQHMWADVFHEMGYKNEFQLPARWRREFARAAALLESVDLGFQETKAAMGTYESSYGAYLDNEQLRHLANRLEVLLEVDQGNVSAAHRLVRVYLALEGSDAQLKETLEKHAPLFVAYAPAWRDVGFALTQLHRKKPDGAGFRQGQVLLRKAINHNPRDVDAHCTLGGTYRKQGKFDEALRCYREGYHKDSTNPYALGNYIVEELIRSKRTDLLNVFHGVIQGALDRCHKTIEVRVNFPWALYDLAMFLLYRGELAESYRYFAKAIDASSRDWMVGTAARTVGRLAENGVPLPGLDLAQKMLNLGERVKQRFRPKGVPAREAPLFRTPLVVLAGGCAGLTRNDQEMVKILPRALAGFRGTLVSGGTNSGIAAIPGDLQLQASRDQMVTIGYVPGRVKDLSKQLHRGYSKIVRTSGDDFSILEPLTFWENYWNAGGNPAQVKLLGFNGGKIAAVEYRLALALGAHVGIVRSSGREADRLLEDPLWKEHLDDPLRKGHARLHSLDPTEEAVRKFLNTNFETPQTDDQTR